MSKILAKTNDNSLIINVLQQENDEDSILNYYKKIIKLRKENEVLIYGDFHDFRPKCNRIYAYTRTLGDKKMLVMNNFTNKIQTFDLPKNLGFFKKKLMLSNYKTQISQTESRFTLRQFESRIYDLEEL
jgi:glycosidase